MTETVAQVFVSLRRSQWLLPWISIVATIYPAYIGARMRPIDGLRK